MNDPITLKINADKYIMMALEEDITSEDISTNSVMPEYQKGEVQLICKQDGIIAGLGVFKRVFELLDDTVEFEMNVKDGDEVKKGQLMAVVTGDITQTDLPNNKKSGLLQATKILKNVSGIGSMELTEKDVVRHELVQRIIRAYEKFEKKEDHNLNKKQELKAKDKSSQK